jgi:hypothetical protein
LIVSRDPCEPILPEDWAELHRRYPHAARIGVAIALARDPETAAALLRGESVAPELLDRVELARARRRLLVRLDRRAIDLLDIPFGEAA